MASHSRQKSASNSPVSGNCVLHALSSDSPPALLEAARQLLLEYGKFVAAQSSIAHFCYGDLEVEAAGLPASYLNQGGGALVASRPGEALGFIAWRTLAVPEMAAAWELKRLWIRPQARGLGLGRILVEDVIQRARSAGISQLLLDTAPESMAAAHRLYLEMGFVECPPYNSQPQPGIVYMHKALGGA